MFKDLELVGGYDFDRYFFSQHGSPLVGIDEAGRGALAGPVVAAAVALNYELPLKGLNDSKLLTAEARENLLTRICANALRIGVGMAFQEEIDQINIYQATIQAMRRAVANTRLSGGLLLIDGLSFLQPSFQSVKVIKGDRRSPAIMAASIVAKVVRDRLMQFYHRDYPQYGFERHKGYTTAEHLRCLQEHGPCVLHRRSFEPVRRVLEGGSLEKISLG